MAVLTLAFHGFGIERPLALGFSDDFTLYSPEIGSDVFELQNKICFKSTVMQLKLITDDDSCSAGGDFNLEFPWKKDSLLVKYGNLKYAGAFSKLKSPELSSSLSPFASTSVSFLELKASLPESTSTSTGGIFAQWTHKEKAPFPLKATVSAFLDSSQKEAVSFYLESSFTKFSSVKLSYTLAEFCYDGNFSDSWFENHQFYCDGRSLSGCACLSVNLKAFYVDGFLCHYENPFPKPSFVYFGETGVRTKNVNAGISAYYNPNKFSLTPSEKKLEPGYSLKTNFTLIQKPGKAHYLYVKEGLSTYFKFDCTENYYPIKICPGFRITSSIFTLSLTGTVNAKILTDDYGEPDKLKISKFSTTLSNSWNIGFVSPGFNLKMDFEPQERKSTVFKTEWINAQSATIYTSISTNPNIEISCSGKMKQKKEENQISELKVSGKIGWHSKRINITGKINLVFKPDYENTDKGEI